MKARIVPLLILWALFFSFACTEDPSSSVILEPGTGSDVEEEPNPQFRLFFEEVSLPNEPKRITELKFLPESSELLLAEQKGTFHHMRAEEEEWVVLGVFDLPDVYLELDCGVLSIAFDPDFKNNRYFYVGHCVSKTHNRITRYVFDENDLNSIGETGVEILSVGDSEARKPWHNIGSIGFDSTGALWALFGEKTIQSNGQDLSNNLGALIRVIPGAEGGYTPAPDNPVFADQDASPDIFAYGLRSPWKGVLDKLGRYWVGDVGAADIEEVNLVLATGGGNYGWSSHEGPCESDCEGFIDPIFFWDREFDHPFAQDDPDLAPAEPRVVWVGVQYQGSGQDRYSGELKDHVLYGDMCLGFVRAATADEEHQIATDRHVGHLEGISAMVEGPDGYIYAATYGNCESNKPVDSGQIWRAVAVWE